MQRFFAVTWLVFAISCSDDDGNDTVPDTAFVETPPALTNQTHVRILFEARGNANAFVCTLDGQSTTCISPFEADVTDGEHTFAVAAALNANVDETPATHTWRVDSVAPDTTITSAPPALDNTVMPMLGFASDDAEATFECATDNGAFGPCTTPLLLDLADGPHSFAVRAKDAAGNVDPTPAMHGWTIDSTAPDTAILTGPANSATTAASGSFTFSSPDATATFECSIDSAAFTTCASPHPFTLAHGPHTFTVRAKDPAGIIDPTPATRSWNVDAQAPPVTITGTPANPSNVTTPQFSFSSTDATATFQCQIDGVVAFTACTSPWTAPTVTDGTRTFRVRATDPVGNVGTAATHGWLVDTVAPAVAFTEEAPASWPVNYFDFRFTTGDATVVECSVDNGAFAPCSSPFTVTAAYAVAHTLRVRGTDAATNSATITSATWTPNRGLVLHYPWEQGDTDNTSLLRQRASHSPDGIAATVSAVVGGWAGSALGSTVSAHQYRATNRPLVSSPDGTYTVSFWIRSTDAASASSIFSTQNSSNGGIRVSLQGGSQLTVATFEGGVAATPLTTTIGEDRWVHVGLRTTGTGKGLEVFVDGMSRGAIATINGFSTGQATNMSVGPWQQIDVDDLRFFNLALTNAQMCTQLARGTMPAGGGCIPMSPGFEIDFEGNRVVDTGAWNMALIAPGSTLGTFAPLTLGSAFRLNSSFDFGYTPNGPSFAQQVAAAPGHSLSFEFIPGGAFGRIIDFTTPCNPLTGGGGLCGIAVSYPDDDRIAIYTGTAVDQKTTTITTAGGIVPDRFNNVVITEQRNANGTLSVTVFVNLTKTTIAIAGGDVFARVSDNVRLTAPGIVVDEYEFWGADLAASLETLCENGVDGEFDVVTNSCLLTYGP